MSEYRTFDQEDKLGPPPWKQDDPELIAWEQAHGHDVRLKCYPEFGCAVLAAFEEAVIEAARAVADRVSSESPSVDALRSALAALDGED